METVCCLTRSEVNPNQSSVPPWSIFHAKLLKNQQVKISQVVYQPMNLASPGAYSIIYNKAWHTSYKCSGFQAHTIYI